MTDHHLFEDSMTLDQFTKHWKSDLESLLQIGLGTPDIANFMDQFAPALGAMHLKFWHYGSELHLAPLTSQQKRSLALRHLLLHCFGHPLSELAQHVVLLFLSESPEFGDALKFDPLCAI